MKMHIAVAVALVAMALPSLAQDTANLTIKGNVPDNTSIALASQSGHDSLDIANGTADKAVATVTEKSNSRTGYKVTLKSANAGTGSQAFLKGETTGNSDTVTYSMKYDGVAVTLSGGEAEVTDAAGRTPQTGVAKNLSVTIASGQWVNTDTYSDTLTLTIAAD